MSKKVLKIILSNIFIFLIFFVSLEFIIYKSALTEFKKFYKYVINIYRAPSFVKSYFVNYQEQTFQRIYNSNDLYFRPILIEPSNKKSPVLIFGCSFAHGANFLTDEQTIAYKIHKNTNRDVYNFAFPSCGIQHMLYFIRNIFPNKFPSNESPEYAIYFYIPNHIFRLRTPIYPTLFSNGKTLEYKLKNGELVLDKLYFAPFYKLFTTKFLLSFYDYLLKKDEKKYFAENFVLLNSIFLESKKTLEKKYPNIKFVIIRYQVENDDDYRELPFMWQVLKNEGFIILNSSDLIGRKYKYNSEDTSEDFYHPSEKAWDLLLPELVKELNL